METRSSLLPAHRVTQTATAKKTLGREAVVNPVRLCCLAVVVGGLLACVEQKSPSSAQEETTDSALPTKEIIKARNQADDSDGRKSASAAFDDAEYVLDGENIPQRASARRIFLRRSRVNSVRDPFMVDNDFVYFVAKVSGIQGMWKLSLEGNQPAELLFARPRFERGTPITRRNRNNWYIGTPRPFPDGKHAIFGGSSQNPQQKYTNILGLVSLTGGPIEPIEIQDVKVARTPDVHPNGKTLVFSSCDGLRLANIVKREEQVISSRKLVDIPREKGARDIACTAFRPRFSPDGEHIVFELIGRFASREFREKYDVPAPKNAGDFVLMPWRVRLDGTELAPLIPPSTFERFLRGRVQTGGTQDPMYAPDGETVAFNHGHRIGFVRAGGESGGILLGNRGAGADHQTGRSAPRARFHESDPVFSPDGKLLISASRLQGAPVRAPPGFSILNVKEAMSRVQGLPRSE